jgi:serine/threonine protein kinase
MSPTTSQPSVLGTPGDLQTGHILNQKYTILRQLGKGGMGALYLASHPIAGESHQVVVKEMLAYYDPKDAQEAARAIKRFEAEAKALTRLHISGVPDIVDYFSETGRYFIVMKYIEGKNLENGLTHIDEALTLVSGKPYPIDQVRRWGQQLCLMLGGLAASHVLHLDIKPSNLIMDRAGTVWLVDFGASKAMQPIGPGGMPGLKKTTIYGTLGYAPPEQSSGKPEPRSDVYALAATRYHLATDDDPGEHPGQFPHLDQLPADFATALRRALIQDVGKRVTAVELARLLEPRTTRPLGFHWQDGTISYDPEELPAEAITHWEDARSYLQSEAWEKWLKDLHRHDLAAELTHIKSQQSDPDLVLDAFLRKLDPSLAPAHLQLPAVLDAGELAWGSQIQLDLPVRNIGTGCLVARLINPPPGVTAQSSELAVRDHGTLKLILDAKTLSPSPQPITLALAIDAGSAGRGQVIVRLTVPEPGLQADKVSLKLGSVYKGQPTAGTVIVSNLGRSPCQVQVSASALWWSVVPQEFELSRGAKLMLKVSADTHRMHLGRRDASLLIIAQAGSWQRSQVLSIQLTISFLKTFWRSWAPPLAWVSLFAGYGAIVGWFLASYIGKVIPFTPLVWQAALIGAVFGCLVCLLPSVLFGVFGRLGSPRGRDGLKAGLMLALLIGAIPGAAIGAVAAWLGAGFTSLSGWAGAVGGIALGIYLWVRARRKIIS